MMKKVHHARRVYAILTAELVLIDDIEAKHGAETRDDIKCL